MHHLRNLGPVLLITMLCAMLGVPSHAQTLQIQRSATSLPDTRNTTSIPDQIQPSPAEEPSKVEPPDAPVSQIASQLTADQQSDGSISGTVLDTNGAQVEGARVTLRSNNAKATRTVSTNSAGLFNFTAIEPGTFKITVISTGFANWVSPSLVLQMGQSYELPPVTLQIASALTNVDVNFTRWDVAEEQVTLEEKQRVLGVFPNFFVSYTWDAAPLSSGQKFRLALRTAYDPVSFAIPAIIAGTEQSEDTFSGYGQGTAGYFKRFGASYGDGFIGNIIGNAILPSVLHQDPRYFYKGTGTIRSRALYAMSTAFICKGDNGRWQPNYSFILGNFASAGISNAYYPASDRNGVGLTIRNALIDTASGAASSLIQEFLIKKISRGVSRGSQP